MDEARFETNRTSHACQAERLAPPRTSFVRRDKLLSHEIVLIHASHMCGNFLLIVKENVERLVHPSIPSGEIVVCSILLSLWHFTTWTSEFPFRIRIDACCLRLIPSRRRKRSTWLDCRRGSYSISDTSSHRSSIRRQLLTPAKSSHGFSIACGSFGDRSIRRANERG